MNHEDEVRKERGVSIMVGGVLNASGVIAETQCHHCGYQESPS